MLVDSFLGLAVMMVCCLFLLPLYSMMQQNAERHQVQLHASQVLYSAAGFVKHRAETMGTQMIDDRQFNWHFDGYELCVQYELDGRETETCVSKTSVASP